jgi:hypothetical protein
VERTTNPLPSGSGGGTELLEWQDLDYEAPWATATIGGLTAPAIQYAVDSHGLVHLRGFASMMGIGGGGAFELLTMLPEEARPWSAYEFFSPWLDPGSATPAPLNVQVNNHGGLFVWVEPGVITISLSGIAYSAEEVAG